MRVLVVVPDLGLRAGTYIAQGLSGDDLAVDLLALDRSPGQSEEIVRPRRRLSIVRAHYGDFRRVFATYDRVLIDVDCSDETRVALSHRIKEVRGRVRFLVHRPVQVEKGPKTPRLGSPRASWPETSEAAMVSLETADGRSWIVPLPLPPGAGGGVAKRRPAGWPFALPHLPTVVTMGHLDVFKGCEALIQAMMHLKEGNVAARLLVLGDGPSRVGLSVQARALGVEAVFPGRVDDPEAWLGASDIYVASQHRDGSGWDVLTAMQLGVPIIANRDVIGFTALFGPNHAGSLIATNDPIRLVAELRTFIDDEEFRQGYRERAFLEWKALAARNWLDAWKSALEAL